MNNSIISEVDEKLKINLAILRITALWGFSEAALGGILHAFKIPFTGLFIGGAAVVFISLLAAFSDKKIIILRSTLIVILIKAIVSPYTPIIAYISVLTQGLLGYALFSSVRPFIAASVMLGVITSFLSAIQKVLILTIVYGNTLWESVDIFSDYVLNQFTSLPVFNFSLSMFIILSYTALHILGGFLFGVLGGRLPLWLNEFDIKELETMSNTVSELEIPKNKRKHKRWWNRLSGLLIVLVSVVLIIISYGYEDVDNSIGNRILIMLGRSVLILVVWYYVLSPYILKIFKKYLMKKKMQYSNDIEESIKMFPLIRSAIKMSWVNSVKEKGIGRYKYFITILILYILFGER